MLLISLFEVLFHGEQLKVELPIKGIHTLRRSTACVAFYVLRRSSPYLEQA